ncbi:MAG: hypothetical protein AAB091_03880 [Elusimicrobiota bacterium]
MQMTTLPVTVAICPALVEKIHQESPPKSNKSKKSKRIEAQFAGWAIKKWRLELPASWQLALGDLPEHLETLEFSRTVISKILPWILRFISILGRPPEEITKDDMERAMAQQRSQCGALSHLCLFMNHKRAWPKSHLRQQAEARLIQRYFPDGWQFFLSDLGRYLKNTGVPTGTRYIILRIATLFIWHSELPAEGVIEEQAIIQSWEGFEKSDLAGLKADNARHEYNRKRALAALWNFLVAQKRLFAAPKEFAEVAEPFWNTLVVPIRSAAYQIFPPCRESDRTDGLRKRMTLYALTLLGFSKHAKARLLSVEEEELKTLAGALAKERFQEETIQQTIADCKAVIQLALQFLNLKTEVEQNGNPA